MKEFAWAMWSYPVPVPVSVAALLALLGFVFGLYQGSKLGNPRFAYPVTNRRNYDQ